MSSVTINNTTYRPNGEARFGAHGYTDGKYKLFAREIEGRVEVFCGSKNWVPHFVSAESVKEDEVVFYVDESNYNLDAYKLLD